MLSFAYFSEPNLLASLVGGFNLRPRDAFLEIGFLERELAGASFMVIGLPVEPELTLEIGVGSGELVELRLPLAAA